MAKIVLDDTNSGYNLATINANLQKIALTLNTQVMYRDNPVGEPNQIQDTVDANNNDIINVHSLRASTLVLNGVDATALVTGAASFATSAQLAATQSAASAVLSQQYAAAAQAAVLPDGSVSNPKIATNAISTVKLQDGSVTLAKLDAGVFSSFTVNDGSITQPKIASNAVTSVKLLDGAVLTAKIADAQVTSSKLDTNLALTGITTASTVNTTALQVLNGVATLGQLGAGQVAARLDYQGNISYGVSGTFGPAQSLATQTNHGLEVWITDVKVGVVANRPDLAGANSTAMAGFMATINTALGVTIKIPDGDYFFQSAITYSAAGPLTFHGQSQDGTRIHICGADHGIQYIPGAQGGGTVKANTLTVKDLSICKAQTAYGGANGGAGIRASWPAGTDNRVHFVMEQVSIYSENSTTIYWAQGVQLTNCNGSRINNVYIKGDINSSGSTTVGNPYGMTNGIYYLNPTNANGCINHYLNNISGGCMGTFLQFDGWYEGVYISNVEFVQPAYGIVVNGYSVTQNSNMFLSNCQLDIRISAIKATYCNNMNLVQCDFYKDGGMGGGAGGTPSNVLDLNNVPRFSMTSSKITNGQGTGASGSNGILVNGTSYNGKIVGNLIEIFPGTGACIALVAPANFWLVASNMFSASNNGVVFNGTQLYASDDNVFQNVTTKYTNTGSNNRIPSTPSF